MNASGAVEEVAGRGYTVVDGVLDDAALDRCRTALEEVFAAEDDIADVRQWRTAAHRVAYMLPAKHPAFLDLARPGPLVDVAAAVLGPDCVLAGFNGLAMVPGGSDQPLHRDHLDPTPGSTLLLHAVLALDDFTEENGATRIVPASHRVLDADAAAGGEPEPVPLPAGAAVAYDACCVHGAGANRTDGPRRALHLLFARRWVRPKWDFEASLDPAAAATLDDERRRLLGFANAPARWDREARRTFGPGWG